MNLDELAELAEGYRAKEAGNAYEARVCMAASCQSSGAPAVLAALTQARGESDTACKVKGVGCMGLCSAGPLVAIAPQGADLMGSTLYRDVKPEDAPDIMASVGGAPLERLRCPTDQPFFARQQRIVLENSGVIDPDSCKGYVAVGGYAALVQVLGEMTPAEVLREVTASGLRGRGVEGAGHEAHGGLVQEPKGVLDAVQGLNQGVPGVAVAAHGGIDQLPAFVVTGQRGPGLQQSHVPSSLATIITGW